MIALVKNKKIVAILIISSCYYMFLFLFKMVFSQELFPYPSSYQISETCIIIDGQATTGPEYRVVKGAGYLLDALPAPHPDNLNTKEIEMTGKSIYDGLLVYPDYYSCEWLAYGKVVGTTDRYEICGSGTIPVFKCKKLSPLMTLSDFLSLEIIMFANFPFGLLITLFAFSWPKGLIIAVLLKRRSKQQK